MKATNATGCIASPFQKCVIFPNVRDWNSVNTKILILCMNVTHRVLLIAWIRAWANYFGYFRTAPQLFYEIRNEAECWQLVQWLDRNNTFLFLPVVSQTYGTCYVSEGNLLINVSAEKRIFTVVAYSGVAVFKRRGSYNNNSGYMK